MAGLNQAAAVVLAWMSLAAVRATVLLTLAVFATRFLRRQSAALKHLLWIVALGATAAQLVLPALLPTWPVVPNIDWPQPRGASAPVPAASHSAAIAGSGRSVAAEASGGRGSTIDESTRPSRAIQRLAAATAFGSLGWLVVWGTGCLLILGRFAWSLRHLARLSRRAAPGAGPELAETTAQIAAGLGIRRPIRLLISPDVDLPMTWGTLRPRVILPADVLSWCADRRRHVLQHELAHVRRVDAATQLIAEIALAIFWFHPLVWYAVARARQERERACDDCVLRHGAKASDYAGDLLAMLQEYGHVDGYASALAVARRSQFEGRLLALLDPAIERRGLSGGRLALVVAVGVLVAAPITTAGRAPTAGPVAPGPALSALVLTVAVHAPVRQGAPPPPRSPARASAPARPVGPPDLFAGCAPTTEVHSHRNLDTGVQIWTVSVSGPDCQLDLTAHGALTISAEATAIEQMASGGWFDASVTAHGETSRVTAYPDTTGAIAYSFVRRGQAVVFAGEGQTWLAAFLILVDRYTAFAVDARLPAILVTGPERALDEIEQMRSDHAKSTYLIRLLGLAPLDRPALARMAAVSATLVTSHDLLSVTRALWRRYDLPAVLVAAVLQYANAAPQDELKVEALVIVARAGQLTGDLRSRYLEIAGTIRTDEARRRALQALGRG